MKKWQLLLLFILLIVVGGCDKEEDPFEQIYLGKVDIIDHINDGDGKLNLKFYSVKQFDIINILIDNDHFEYDFKVIAKNQPITIKNNDEIKDGFLHIVRINFLGDSEVDLTHVIGEFDRMYRQFEIGRYQRIDVEKVTGMKLSSQYYNIDFVIPLEITSYSYIPNLNIDVNVINNNSFPVLSKSIMNVNENPYYEIMVLENIQATPFIEASSSKITKRIYLQTANEFVHIKTYFVYEFVFEKNTPQRDYVLVCLEIGSDQSVYKLSDELVVCDTMCLGENLSYLR